MIMTSRTVFIAAALLAVVGAVNLRNNACALRNDPSTTKGDKVWCKCNVNKEVIGADGVTGPKRCVDVGGGRVDVCKWDAAAKECVPKCAYEGATKGDADWCKLSAKMYGCKPVSEKVCGNGDRGESCAWNKDGSVCAPKASVAKEPAQKKDDTTPAQKKDPCDEIDAIQEALTKAKSGTINYTRGGHKNLEGKTLQDFLATFAETKSSKCEEVKNMQWGKAKYYDAATKEYTKANKLVEEIVTCCKKA